MLIEGIKSRPVYGGIKLDRNARNHLFALEGEGALALIEQVSSFDEACLSKMEILYVAAGSNHGQGVAAIGAAKFWKGPTVETLAFRLKGSLGNARMGTRLYAAGREGFIGQCVKMAMEMGMDHTSIRTEHRGSLARRVQCVHCKGVTEDVTTSHFACSHCNLNLLVRDHYSRRLAAFQGVNIDAEEPGVVPPAEELFR